MTYRAEIVLAGLPRIRAVAFAADTTAARSRCKSVAFSTRLFPSMACGYPLTTKHVDFCCNGFQMFWAHAFSHSTEMIKVQALWDWSDKLFVAPSMRADIDLVQDEDAVSLIVDAAGIDPTRTKIGPTFRDRSILIDTRPKSIGWRFSFVCAMPVTEALRRAFRRHGKARAASLTGPYSLMDSHVARSLGVAVWLGARSVFSHRCAPFHFTAECAA